MQSRIVQSSALILKGSQGFHLVAVSVLHVLQPELVSVVLQLQGHLQLRLHVLQHHTVVTAQPLLQLQTAAGLFVLPGLAKVGHHRLKLAGQLTLRPLQSLTAGSRAITLGTSCRLERVQRALNARLALSLNLAVQTFHHVLVAGFQRLFEYQLGLCGLLPLISDGCAENLCLSMMSVLYGLHHLRLSVPHITNNSLHPS
mmetsp:Transcript_14374/g.19685  ORF Transcript_14374/g.19685 Transcript_14374/m.19685 type:complete len:200 (-) Transcript_14374:332-931(-)